MNPYTRTAEVLRERGRTTCSMERPDGTVCLVGALRIALGLEAIEGGATQDPHIQRLLGIIVEQYPECLLTWETAQTRVTYWNDAYARDDEVFAVLDKAAVQWEEQVT